MSPNSSTPLRITVGTSDITLKIWFALSGAVLSHSAAGLYWLWFSSSTLGFFGSSFLWRTETAVLTDQNFGETEIIQNFDANDVIEIVLDLLEGSISTNVKTRCLSLIVEERPALVTNTLDFVTLDTSQSISGAKVFAASNNFQIDTTG